MWYVSAMWKMSHKLLFLPLLLVLLGACVSEPADPMGGDGAGAQDMMSSAEPCGGACGGGQVCVDNRCQPLPASCPCPKESYCDLASNTCRAGCVEDGQCLAGRFCDTAKRSCKVGCSMDSQCGAGNICDGTQQMCRPGCRMDGQCTGGKRCDSKSATCLLPCTMNDNCPLDQFCDRGSMLCRPGCAGDSSKCPVGTACLKGMTGRYYCSATCLGMACSGKDWVCVVFKSGESQCRKSCTNDAACGVNNRCRLFATDPMSPAATAARYCATDCAIFTVEESCNTSINGGGMMSCTCSVDSGQCTAGGAPCYITGPKEGPP